MLLTDQIKASEAARLVHHAGGLSYQTLARIESLLPQGMKRTAETGCGRSTILFSNFSKRHTVFCLDDRDEGDLSSVRYFETSSFTKPAVINPVFGPTQLTLPTHVHEGPYDCVLIDGPHGYPFPEIEYYYFYPHIRKGGLLIIDDVQIATIGRMADFLQEDAMWDLVELSSTTAIFRRTDARTFTPTGDHWWQQNYNRRRTEADKPFLLKDGGEQPSFAERLAMASRKRRKPLFTRLLRKLRRAFKG